MSSDFAIQVERVSKCYQIYAQPRDRLAQFVLPRFRGVIGLPAKQYYREFWALRETSFDIRMGETFGIVGSNGSGKSTLLQMICGTLNPTSGQIRSQGRLAALLELGSGFNPEFTGRENIFMNGAVLGLSKDEIVARYDRIVSFSGIGEFVEEPVRSYSSGMMVRLAFSVAINVDPEILVIDEALAVGDELFQRKCYAELERLKARGATILFVSHSASADISLCDRALLIDRGNQLAVGSPRRIIAAYQKLLYAPDETRERVKKEVREMFSGDGQHQLTNVQESVPAIMPAGSTFDPGLESQTRLELEPAGARILNPALFDEDGKQVNMLVKGQRYHFRYRVYFDQPASQVRFGMLVKSLNGMHLGGALSAATLREAIDTVASGCIINVCFGFDCMLNPGTYFLNAGAFADAGEGETVMHRIIDALAFRVQTLKPDLATELIDFGFSAEVRTDA